MQQTPDEWALPVWEGSDTYGLAGNTVALQPQFANAVSAALTQAKSAGAPQTISDATTTDANGLGSGTYHVPFMSTAQKVSNLPVTWPGVLVTHGTGSVRTQLFMPSYTGNTTTNGSGNALIYARRTNQSGGWHPWQRVDPTQGREGALRLADLRHRVGPVTVTTPAAVTIIMDHGLTNVKSKVLPLMRARGLTATLAINSQKWSDAANSGASQADVKTWTDVFEFANHGRTHLLTGNPAADLAEIEGGRQELESQLATTVDTWVQTGNGSAGSYDFDDGRTAKAYWETDTGRIIARTHAVWTGLVPNGTGIYPLDGHPNPGAQGTWIDTDAGRSAAQTLISSAVSNGGGVIVRLHPQYLDQSGYLTTAQLTSFLDWLVARRSAAEVTVLTFRQWSLARRSEAERDTGWRNITPAGVLTSGALLIRRRGLEVTLKLDAAVFAAPTGNIFLGSLPFEFRPTYRERESWYLDQNQGSGGTINISPFGSVSMYGASSASAPHFFSARYFTVDSWPTALPGVAA